MKKVLAVAAAALIGVLSFAAPASAADHTKHMHTGDAFGSVTGWSGEGVFTEEGDRVHICDTDADGRGVIIYVYKGTPASGTQLYSINVGGEGSCVTKSAANGGVYNLPESRVGFKFCRYWKADDRYHAGECQDYDFLNDNN
ncbi:hypothetical protein ACIA5G_46245 [Amycolatopsis sp. NPDC051758]|uniref:hypothetical protein n=1 Tax=Amycolatopsis sp. NPDC051758 TaxID=3363935 RepID=UPI0037B9C853